MVGQVCLDVISMKCIFGAIPEKALEGNIQGVS